MGWGRVATVVAAALVCGCATAPTPSSSSPAGIGSAEGAPAPVWSVPISFTGTTGARVCIVAVLILECAIAEGGKNDRHDLGCERGTPELIWANVTWDDAFTPPQDFQSSIGHRGENDAHWNAEPEDSNHSASSPLSIRVDLDRYAGEKLDVSLHSWRLLAPQNAGVLVNEGIEFNFSGNLTCAE